MKKINGLMTKEGFAKLQENTANIYLAKCNNDEALLQKLNDERKVICDDENNYVPTEENKLEAIENEFKKYLIAPLHEDYFIISVTQEDKINRPNNADDEDIINSYMENNFGDRPFEIIPLDYLPIVNI